MAVTGINPVQPREKKDTLDKILQGVSIAEGILGIGLKIPEYLQKRQIGKLEQSKTQAEIDALRAESQPAPPEAIKYFTDLGVQPFAMPQTLGQARGLAAKLMQPQLTPQQQFTQDMQTKHLGIAEEQLGITKEREKRAQEDEERKRKQLYIPDLGQSVSDPKDARDAKQTISTTKTVLNDLDDLIAQRKDLIENVGGGTLDPNKRKLAKQKMRTIQLALKSPEFFALGVLTGPDMQLIEDTAPTNPLAPSLVSAAGLGDPIMGQLEQLRNFVRGKSETFLTSRGLQVPQDFYEVKGGVGQTEQNEDQQALDWANKNPNDPRAKAIKQRLGQ